ncbi:MAG TPA: SigE family RNA polymerase sigma factor [Pilimelia sp.]|nr:SigE family RNA polymerase sigma factor [Pilimelia sp.]
MRWQRHDGEREFTEYFSARFHQTRRLAYLLCGDWHRADDLAQSAFVRVAGSWHRVRDAEALDAYLRTCLMRSFFSDQRRAWRRREATAAELPDRPAGTDDADDAATRIAITRALLQVPPRQRAVLVCRYYDGLDVAATAQVLGCAEGTVKSQCARGLAALRAALGGQLTNETALPGAEAAGTRSRGNMPW